MVYLGFFPIYKHCKYICPFGGFFADFFLKQWSKITNESTNLCMLIFVVLLSYVVGQDSLAYLYPCT